MTDGGSNLPARADLLAPDLGAVSAILDAGARRDGAVRDSVALSAVADLAGATVTEHPVVRAVGGLPTSLRPPTAEPAPMPLVLPADKHQRAALDAIAW